MNRSKRFHHVFGGMLIACFALFVIGAGSASAAVHWSDTTHGIRVSGTLFVTKNSQTKKCEASAGQYEVAPMETASAWLASDKEWGELDFKCESGAIFGMMFNLTAKNTSEVEVGLNQEYGLNPWGPYGFAFYHQVPATVKFQNGTSTTPSVLGFGNTLVGFVAGEELIAGGKLFVTTASGGLLTLQP